MINNKQSRLSTQDIVLFLLLALSWVDALYNTFADVRLSNIMVCIKAIISSTVCLISIWTNRRIGKFGVSFAVILYTILSAIGMCCIYFLFPGYYPDRYRGIKVVGSLSYAEFPNALAMSMLAVLTYCLVAFFYTRKRYGVNKLTGIYIYDQYSDPSTTRQRNIIVWFGYLLLFFTCVYFVFQLFLGRISISMTYKDYRAAIINDIYTYIVTIYSTGICFVVACANKKQLRIGLGLFGFVAIILMLTGNRGEVLYAALACIGIWYYRAKRIGIRLMIILLILFFVIIPIIASTRNMGVVGNIKNVVIGWTDSIVEIGMQLRLAIYTMNEVNIGAREFLYGFSYYNPFINILNTLVPIIPRLDVPVAYNFKAAFPTMGFSFIAEAYCNFGVLGVITIYGLLAWWIAKMESRNLKPIDIATFGAITSVIINLTRNRFSIAPVMILFILLIRLICKLIIGLGEKRQNERGQHAKDWDINLS